MLEIDETRRRSQGRLCFARQEISCYNCFTMNQKGFISIITLIGIVILFGIAGYILTNTQIPVSLPIPAPVPTPDAPVIERIVPEEATFGAQVSIIGSGFTPDKNSLHFGAGFAYLNNLTSSDGKTILFTLPDSFDTCNPDGSACAEFLSRPVPGQTYEVAVINANGTSNAVNFTVARARVTSAPGSVPYNEDGTCPPGYINYGVPLMCVTPEYAEYCKTNPCPICLAANTLIDTPSGLVLVEDLQVGMPVWTMDSSGVRMVGVVMKTSRVPAPPAHEMVHLILNDSRELFASFGHPIIDGRIVGDLAAGDLYDGASVASAKRVPYGNSATYDILPSGDTGFYWANGILLGSTLRSKDLLQESN